MNAPFYKFGSFGDEASLVLAFAIGLGFGFFLERAGFGSARKLAGQLYFTDLAVFKVMFTAIVTAMLGLFYLSWMGVLDLSLVYLSPTRMAPQVVGGLLLGVGFVVGGYCPGTSVVAISTGRIDAIVYGFGILAGIFAFGQAYPVIEGFFYATDMGAVTLPAFFGIPYGVLVLAGVVMALGGFWGCEISDRRMAGKS